MTKEEAKEIYGKIRSEYEALPYPKYLNADLEDIKKKYQSLMELKEHLSGDLTYIRLINSISQTIARLSKKSAWSNVSERGVNKSLPFLTKKGGKEIVFPFEWDSDKSSYTCSINGYWGAKNHMVMDLLGHFFLLKEGGDRLPKEKSLVFDNLESVRAREMELNEQVDEKTGKLLPIDENTLSLLKNRRYWVRFDDHYFRKFTGKISMHSNDILSLLLETSRVEFKIAFPVRLQEGLKNGIEEKWYPMNIFSRLFELGYKDNERKDGVVLSRTYFIFFNTILGELFVHNLLTKGYDWVHSDLYNLPPSAQILYRRFFLHHNYQNIQLNLETIVESMNFTEKDRADLIGCIEKNSLEPLKKNGLILSYEKKEGLQGLKYLITLPQKSKLTREGIAGSEGKDSGIGMK